MKKVTLSFILFFSTLGLNSQINLEHTYTVSGASASIRIIQLANSGYKYCVYEFNTNQFKLYNTDHSLWKTITYPTISGSTASVWNISETLFNTDGLIEYIVHYTTSTSPFQYQIKILNENGVLIKDLPNRTYTAITPPNNIVQSIGVNSYKLVVSDGNTIREVYSLPGTTSNLGVSDNPMSELSGISFPNPTSQTITIPYQLANGQTSGQLKIYNSTGALIESFQVDSNFNDLILDVSSYSNGVYLYKIVSNGIESESKSFVKQ